MSQLTIQNGWCLVDSLLKPSSHQDFYSRTPPNHIGGCPGCPPRWFSLKEPFLNTRRLGNGEALQGLLENDQLQLPAGRIRVDGCTRTRRCLLALLARQSQGQGERFLSQDLHLFSLELPSRCRGIFGTPPEVSFPLGGWPGGLAVSDLPSTRTRGQIQSNQTRSS